MDKIHSLFKGCVRAWTLVAGVVGVAQAAYLPGLIEYSNSKATGNKPLCPTKGGETWTTVTTYSYDGQIYLDGSTYFFAENIDETTVLKLKGNTVLNATYATAFQVSSKIAVGSPAWYTGAGWYSFNVAFKNTGGGGGVRSDTRDCNGRLCGFGLCKQETAPKSMAECVFPEDDGSATLFRYAGGSQKCLEIAGSPDQYGTPSPNYGYYPNLTAGENYTLTCPAAYTNTAEGIVYRCAGWTLKKGTTVTASGTENTYTYHCASPTDPYTLTWQWEKSHYWLDISVNDEEGGTVDVPSCWMPVGTNVWLTATPSVTHEFWKWSGEGLNADLTYAVTNVVAMSAPRQVTANFYDPYVSLKLTRYVTPTGAGDADGTDWDNACSNVVDAYNMVAANPGGGEVWIRYGAYKCTGIVLHDNIIVRGGFAGDETSSDQADPENNPTILHDGTFKTTETWQDTAKSEMWTTDANGRYVFIEPPSAGDTTTYKGATGASKTTGFTYDSVRDISPIEFHGITFTRYGSSAITITANIATPLVLRKCRFVNIGWYADDNHAVHLTGIGVDAEDCEFIGAQESVFLTTAATSSRRASTFNRCRFYSTGGRSNRCGGIHATQNTQVTLTNCTFDRNLASTSAGALYVNTAGDLTIEDCVFTRGRCDNNTYGGAICYNPTQTATLTIRRSRFEKCVCTAGPTSGKSAASALAVWGAANTTVTGNVENVAFVGNTYDASTGYPAASCVAFCAGSAVNYAFNFINCLFENNRAAHTSSSSALYNTVSSSTTVAPCATFAHCVFKNNVCGYKSGSTYVRSSAEFGTTAGDKPRFTFVNTVFDNDVNQPSWRTDKPFSFANCATKSTSAYGTAATGCFRLGTLANNATIALEASSRTNGLVVARKLAPASAYRRKGCPVWQATNGGLYLYDAANTDLPWLACWTTSAGLTRLTPTQAAAIGLSTSNPSLPDAFDESREGQHPAMGNLNAVVRGLRIGIKKDFR